MAVNQRPIFTYKGDVSANGGAVLTANMGPSIVTATADFTGISANYMLVFTADATNGSFVQRLRFKAEGTCIASCARIFINNGGVQTLVQNNAFYGECPLPAVTATSTQGTTEVEYSLNFAINPGFRIYVGLGATVASGWTVTAVAGSY